MANENENPAPAVNDAQPAANNAQPAAGNAQPAANAPRKSDAPWILGIIGFATAIPNILCATICAAAVAGVAEAAGEDAATTGHSIAGALLFIVLINVLCFVLSFFGKSKQSHVTGILMIIGGLIIVINGFIGLASVLWSLVSGVLFLLSGCFSVKNHKIS